jgi:hypothetical protein
LNGRSVRRAYVAILLLGAAARIAAWRLVGGLHPDEFFQALEPAWWRLSGVGLASWEWRDGVRSWVLPAYNGGWMALLMKLGVRRGDILGSIMQLHWALVSLVLVVAAFRGGSYVTRRLEARGSKPSSPAPLAVDAPPAGWRGGLLAAALCALFPPIVSFSPHTLSELPSMLCLVLGLVLTLETSERESRDAVTRKRVFFIGALLSLGVCLRIANAPLVLVAPLVLLLRRRYAHVAWLALGAALPIAIFGVVDLVTWGKFLGSFIGYVDYNLVQGKAAEFGTMPRFWYVGELWHRAPIGLPLVMLPLLFGWRATWPFVLSALGLVVMLSTQAHKEERFVIAFWPFVIIGAAGVVGAWLATARAPRRRLWTHAACAACASALLLDGAVHLGGGENTFARAKLEGQIAAGRDANVTGLLIDNTFYSGASLWFGRSVPQLEFDAALLGNPMISHALVAQGSDNERVTIDAGFSPIFSHDRVVLLRRR